jgi:predicted porin
MMNKQWMAATALALAGTASAQTAVPSATAMTIYGRLDLSVGQEYGTGDTFMANGSGSRLGLRGAHDLEDLGLGGKAFFNIEHRFKGDTGAVDSTTSFWNGRAVAGLAGAFGEVVLGREYSPAYNLAQSLSDPWGYDTVAGAGAEYAMLQNKLAKKRYDNSVSYNLSMGGFKLGLQTAEGDGLAKRPANLGLGWQEGDLKLGLGYEKTGASDKAHLLSLAGSYQMGPVRVMAGLGKGEDAAKKEYESLQLGAAWKLGKGELRAGVTTLENTTSNTKLSQQLALGYHHALNKTVTVYADVARDNKRFTGTQEDLAADVGLKVNF